MLAANTPALARGLGFFRLPLLYANLCLVFFFWGRLFYVCIGLFIVMSQVMWRAVERALGPGFSRDKCEVKLVGSPLTHQRFLRRNRGTYGPAIQAGKDSFPGHSTPIPQLYCCGDSTFPGIGVPAVAASGAIVANSLVSVSQHSELLDAIGI